MIKPHIQSLLEDRYFLRDKNGELLEKSLEQMYDRVAWAVAMVEETPESQQFTHDDFYDLMVHNKFLPNTPTLINAGKENSGSFSGCFVLPIEDSMEGIFDAVKNASLIHKAGGGTGFNFSSLREEGSIVGSTGHKSSGPLEFMKVFNQAMDTVKQGGARRGASMGILNVDHPDIMKFIHMKEETSNMTNFNLSVLVTDAFMEAVDNDDAWDLVSPKDGKTIIETLSARDIWNAIVEQAWETGEPGIIFKENLNADNPILGEENQIIATNPCGELGLRSFESCNLGSINLLAYYQEVGGVDYETLREDIPVMVRFLDNVIDANNYILPEIEAATKATRKIGLGVMGWADLLIMMNIRYDSDEALELAEDIMDLITNTAFEASRRLGEERGNFPLWENSTYSNHTPMRNATRLCVAPTGTISRIAGVSSGIEPIFAWETQHNLSDREYSEVHWALEDIKKKEQEYAGNVRIPRPDYMVTASEIAPEWHLQHQAVFQNYIDNSVSKTINLPSSATVEDVDKIYREAFKLVKGITVYRDGSRDNQPLSKIKPPSGVTEAASHMFSSLDELDQAKVLDYSEVLSGNVYPRIPKEFRKRPAIVFGPTYKVDTGKGKMYVTVNYSHEENEPVEVFLRMGHKSTGTEHELAEWSGRLLSLLLKHNIPIEDILRQSIKVMGDNGFFFDQRSFRSLPQLVSHLIELDFNEALEKMDLEDGIIKFEPDFSLPAVRVEENIETRDVVTSEYCYECGSYAIVREGGCDVCTNCGDSKCG